jgi:hypothetical protein
MTLEFTGDIFEWRGPAPFLFVAVPDELSRELKAASRGLTYGWGVIPVVAFTGQTRWNTSLFPKDGRYLVPVKVAVQRAESLGVGDTVKVRLELG